MDFREINEDIRQQFFLFVCFFKADLEYSSNIYGDGLAYFIFYFIMRIPPLLLQPWSYKIQEYCHAVWLLLKL